MIGQERTRRFLDKLAKLTKDKELKWDSDLLYTFCARINDSVSVTIDTRHFKIGVIIASAGRTPIWLEPDQHQCMSLIDVVEESRRMPDHVALWITEYLKK